MWALFPVRCERTSGSDLQLSPPVLREPLVTAKKLYEPYTTGASEQQALAEWMKSGRDDRHMRRMRRIYGRLEGTLRRELEGMVGGLFRVYPSDAGLHLYAQWGLDAVQYDQLIDACWPLGVEGKDARVFDAQGGNRPPSAIFGLALLEEEQIREGMARIRCAAERLQLV